MPEPRDGEEHDDFVDRCMGDEVMNREYEEPEQRRAVCESQWEGKEDGGARDEGRGEARREPLGALLDYVQAGGWAMQRDVLQQMVGILQRHVQGVRLTASDVAAATAPQRRVSAVQRELDERGYRRIRSNAVIPITGVIAKHAGMVNGVSQPQGTSTARVHWALGNALKDEAVKKIILHIESPGGQVHGTAELADAIYAASAEKPVISYIEDQGTSAAYWLASQAQAVFANRPAIVGSIGVYAVVIDSSRAAENEGLRFHLLRSGEHKGAGAAGVPVTDRQLDQIQMLVDGRADLFAEHVLRGRAAAKRRLDPETLATFRDGRDVLAAQAVEVGLIDGIASFRQVLAFAAPKARAMAALAGGIDLTAEGAEIGERDQEEETADAAGMDAGGETETDVGDEAMSDADKKKAEDAARQEGAKAERERISGIRQALPGKVFTEAVEKAIQMDLDVEAAVASAMPAAMARIEELEGALALAKEKLDTIAKGGRTPVARGDTDDQAELLAKQKADADKADPAKAFEARVAALTAGGLKRSKAISQASEEMPEGHDAWIDAQQK